MCVFVRVLHTRESMHLHASMCVLHACESETVGEGCLWLAHSDRFLIINRLHIIAANCLVIDFYIYYSVFPLISLKCSVFTGKIE